MNIISELNRLGLQVRKGPRDGEIKVCCPFCTSMGTSQDTRYRLGVNLISGKANCFNCGWYSHNQGITKLLRQLGSRASDIDVSMSDFAMLTDRPKEKIVLPFGFEKLENVDDNDPLFGQARRYVKKRGITTRQLHEHEIGATVADDRYRYRIIFPVRKDKKLVGLVARDWTGKKEPKYLNSSSEKIVYNADPKKYGAKMVIVSEGITKALAIERAFYYKVCSGSTLGNRVSDPQANQLTKFEEVVLFPDPDKPGIEGYLGAGANLESVVQKVSIVWPWPMEQADDMSTEEIQAVVRDRKLLTAIVYSRLKSELFRRGMT